MQRPRRWLFVLPWEIDAPGGVNTVVRNLMHQVASAGQYEPLLLICSWEHRLPRLDAGSDGRLVRMRLPEPWSSRRGPRVCAGFTLGFATTLLRLRRLLREQLVDVINPHFPTLGALHFAALRRLGFPAKLVLSVHGLEVREAVRRPGLRPAWRTLLRSADATIACSQSLRTDVVGFVPRAAERVFAVHNGVDADSIRAASDRGFPLPETLRGVPLVVNVATWEFKKGQDVLIRAFERVAPRFPTARLALVGRSGDSAHALREQVERSPLRARIVLAADVPHARVWPYLDAATVVVQPSREEPFGIAILEAGAEGKAVIASRVDGIPEILTHDVTGRLVAADDVAGLAAELDELLRDAATRNRLGEALRAHVRDRFSWQSAYEGYMQILAG